MSVSKKTVQIEKQSFSANPRDGLSFFKSLENEYLVETILYPATTSTHTRIGRSYIN